MEMYPALPSHSTIIRLSDPDWTEDQMEVEGFQYHSSNFGPAPKSNLFFILQNTTNRHLSPHDTDM